MQPPHTPEQSQQAPLEETFEHAKGQFTTSLNAVTSLTISPENITSFYDHALHRLTGLIDEIVPTYLVSHTGAQEQGKALEDKALAYYGLTSVHNILTAIGQHMMLLQEVEHRLQTMSGFEKEVFVPPNKESSYLVTGSNAGFEKKKLIPRLMTLGYILEHDCGITLTDTNAISIVSGDVTSSMMRESPYIRVAIAPLNRIVYLCNEEGNASFVFDQEKVLAHVGTITLLDVMEKRRYKEMIAHDGSIGTVIRQSALWRADMYEALTESLQKEGEETKAIPKELVSPDFKKIIPKKEEGWGSANVLKKMCNVDVETMKSFAETFRKKRPEWFEVQKVRGQSAEHYHPDLVAKLVEHFKKGEGLQV